MLDGEDYQIFLSLITCYQYFVGTCIRWPHDTNDLFVSNNFKKL